MLDNSTIRIIQSVGSPFVQERETSLSEAEIKTLYPNVFENRIELLFLEKTRAPGWDDELEELYIGMQRRYEETISVIVNLCQVLNELCPNEYMIFKSIKPFPATPNDTDSIFLGSKKRYQEVSRLLVDAGYKELERAPLQITYYDSRGKGKVHSDKRGGTYYIDFYENIGTDYFVYVDKRRLQNCQTIREISGVDVPLMNANIELAIFLFHSVFPEKTYHIEHFYVALHTISRMGHSDIELFCQFIKDNHLKPALKGSLGITAHLHNEAFGFVPDVLTDILKTLGGYRKPEVEKLVTDRLATPYLFTLSTFALAFVHKLLDPRAVRSLFVQGAKMANPAFAWDVFTVLRKRCGSKGLSHHME